MTRWLLSALVVAIICGFAFAAVPCTSTGTPAGCDNTRWHPCGFYSNLTYTVIKAGFNTDCTNVQNGVHRGQQYVAQFTGQTGTCTEILIAVGECWGTNANNGGSYGCQGRCGPDCQPWYAICSNWAMDCLRHDACSWYYNSANGASDPNCGDEYNLAQDDWGTDCVFATNWCMLLTPTQSSTCCSTASPDPGTC